MYTTRVTEGDALTFKCDVLILKYAQGFYGVDAAVASVLRAKEPRLRIQPKPGSYSLVPTHGLLGARFVLFIGVVDLARFDYGQIRSFVYLGLQALSRHEPGAQKIAMTIHGPGYGLDEREAFLALVAGLSDATNDGIQPDSLQSIAIIELNAGRAKRLAKLLAELGAPRVSRGDRPLEATAIDAGTASSRKPHVFVAMPFSEGEMEDVYGFGIQGPVNSAGYLCERVDMTAFTGDILTRVRERIETASLVVADLTGANPNVYLEVGYAWGKNKATVLLARKGSDLKFDVKGHRCLLYANITELSKKLSVELAGLT